MASRATGTVQELWDDIKSKSAENLSLTTRLVWLEGELMHTEYSLDREAAFSQEREETRGRLAATIRERAENVEKNAELQQQ